MVGATSLSLSLASVPNRVTDDTELHENLTEVNVRHQKDLSFKSDLARLASLEPSYREELPRVSPRSRIMSPAERISKKKYRASQRTQYKTQKARR